MNRNRREMAFYVLGLFTAVTCNYLYGGSYIVWIAVQIICSLIGRWIINRILADGARGIANE